MRNPPLQGLRLVLFQPGGLLHTADSRAHGAGPAAAPSPGTLGSETETARLTQGTFGKGWPRAGGESRPVRPLSDGRRGDSSGANAFSRSLPKSLPAPGSSRCIPKAPARPATGAPGTWRRGGGRCGGGPPSHTLRGYLVDPASSICLSQRLSHASLSTHGRYSETANGSLNQLWFL